MDGVTPSAARRPSSRGELGGIGCAGGDLSYLLERSTGERALASLGGQKVRTASCFF